MEQLPKISDRAAQRFGAMTEAIVKDIMSGKLGTTGGTVVGIPGTYHGHRATILALRAPLPEGPRNADGLVEVAVMPVAILLDEGDELAVQPDPDIGRVELNPHYNGGVRKA